MKIVYRLFQLFVAFPIMLVISVLTALVTTLGCTIGSAHFWGYYPPMIWSKLMCWFFLLPVKVEGKTRLDPSSSYVFVANHQGAHNWPYWLNAVKYQFLFFTDRFKRTER